MAAIFKAAKRVPKKFMSSRKLNQPDLTMNNNVDYGESESDSEPLCKNADKTAGTRGGAATSAPRKLTAEGLLGPLPPPAQWILQGRVARRGVDGKYHRRQLVLTKTTLFLSSAEDAAQIKDCIPLMEIVGIRSPIDLNDGKMENGDPTEALRFELSTRLNGYNSGVSYDLGAGSELEKDAWIQAIIKARGKLEDVNGRRAGMSKLRKLRRQMKRIYESSMVQMCVATLVFLNFIATAAQAELQPDPGSNTDSFFATLDLIFTSLFTVELAVNMASNWFRPFWSDGWSVFDFVVVSVSLIGLVVQNLPGVSTLRLMRAFRVMRLFGRLESLRCIINALTASILPVCNAFLIMLLVTSIYAILGNSFFGTRSDEFFGKFSVSFFSMFQVRVMPSVILVLTGDAWASEIARPLFQTRFDGPVVAFFGSFIVIVGWTLLQVVVAVLLEHFGAAANREKERALTQRAVEAGHSAPHFCTDPLMASLAHFDTNADLSQRIKTLFQALDTDESKTLSFRELQSGLRKLNFKPRIRLSEDDFDVLTISRTLCTASGEVDAISFERIMRHQLAVYVQRQVAVAMSLAPENDVNQTGTILFVLKLIKNGISEILDNGSGNGIIGCNGGSGSARSISKTEPEASLSSPVAGPARLGKINGCHPTLESMIAGLQHSMDLVLSKLKIDKEDSIVGDPGGIASAAATAVAAAGLWFGGSEQEHSHNTPSAQALQEPAGTPAASGIRGRDVAVERGGGSGSGGRGESPVRRTLRRASTFALDVLQIPGSHDGLLELAFGPSTPPPEPEGSTLPQTLTLLSADETNGLQPQQLAEDTKMPVAAAIDGVSTRLHMEPLDSLATTRPRAGSGSVVLIPLSSLATATLGKVDGRTASDDDDDEGHEVDCPEAGPLPHFSEWQRIRTGLVTEQDSGGGGISNGVVVGSSINRVGGEPGAGNAVSAGSVIRTSGQKGGVGEGETSVNETGWSSGGGGGTSRTDSRLLCINSSRQDSGGTVLSTARSAAAAAGMLVRTRPLSGNGRPVVRPRLQDIGGT